MQWNSSRAWLTPPAPPRSLSLFKLSDGSVHFLELLVTSISQFVGGLFPSADERKIDIAVRITLVVIIFIIILTPVYVFLR